MYFHSFSQTLLRSHPKSTAMLAMDSSSVYLCTFLCLLRLVGTDGAKIIMASPQFRSHVHVQATIGKELVLRGHEVYMAMASRYERPERLERLGLKILYYHMPNDVIYGLGDDFCRAAQHLAFEERTVVYAASLMANRDCDYMMSDEDFKRKAKGMNFDLAFLEPFICSPCYMILGRYLNVPFVSMATMLAPWGLRLPALPSFHRVLAEFPFADESSFSGRFLNLVSYLAVEWSYNNPGPQNTTLLKLYAPKLNSWDELTRQSELILSDIDYHMGSLIPNLPYLVTVAGITTRPAEKLEPEWEKLVTENEHGVVFMSFGAAINILPKYVTLKFLEAFSELKQTVIARFEAPDSETEIPKNVKLVSWIPQNDLLGHANVKLFITHCGNSGQHELLYHGVPFVGFPMFGDQVMNCEQAQDKGFGISMNTFSFSSKEFLDAMEEVLENPKYRSAVKRASEIFRDQPLPPLKKAVFWIEHVIKYGGSHLRPKSIDLPLYQFLMLDVLVVVMIVVLLLFKLISCLVIRSVQLVVSWRSGVTLNGSKLKSN